MEQNLSQNEIAYVTRMFTASRRAQVAIGIGFLVAALVGIIGFLVLVSPNSTRGSSEILPIFVGFLSLLFVLFGFLILRAKPKSFEPRPSVYLTGVYHIRSFGGGKTRTQVDYIDDTPIVFQKHWRSLLTLGSAVEVKLYPSLEGEDKATVVPQNRAILLEIVGKADINSEVNLGLLDMKSNIFGGLAIMLWFLAIAVFGFSSFGGNKFIELKDLALSFEVVFGGFWALSDAFLLSGLYLIYLIALVSTSIAGIIRKVKNDGIIKKIVAARNY